VSGFGLFSCTAVWSHQFDVVWQRTLLHDSLFVAVVGRQFVDHLRGGHSQLQVGVAENEHD